MVQLRAFYSADLRRCVTPFKLHLDRLLEPGNWISINPFYLKIEIQYWQFTSILKWNFNIDKIGLILSVQYWSSSSILRWIVNIEFQFWGKMSILKFNFEVPKACPNEAETVDCDKIRIKYGPLFVFASVIFRSKLWFIWDRSKSMHRSNNMIIWQCSICIKS